MTHHDYTFATRAVHSGERPADGRYTPVVTPIHPSVSYLYENMDDLDAVFSGRQKGYVYHRFGNPTLAAFEEAMADLEKGESAYAFGSGMAAIHTALLAAGVRAGATVVAALDLYGATHTLLTSLFSTLGASVHLVDVNNLAGVEQALEKHGQENSTALFAETISNPLLKIADVPALAELAHQYGAQLLIDNTFASPWLFNPLEHGADMTIHSATKYIGGHGDVMAGVVAASTQVREKLFEMNKLVGGVLGPFEAWLALRGLKTLSLRMKQHCANAMQVAQWLAQHPRIARVNYPGLENHPQHDLARKLFNNASYGGMVSFEIAGADQDSVFRFMESLELILPATSLGDVYSLILHPASSSHRGLTPEERERVGIREELLRVSVGIEDAGDIIRDLEKALDAHCG
ncbi:MAG: PLP-dependent transferase [Anaerolineales bacterium]|nr:PLP-dependent transferase [Anaerolineales bacterium]